MTEQVLLPAHDHLVPHRRGGANMTPGADNHKDFIQEIYELEVARGEHDEQCEAHKHPWICHCEKRARIARGITTPPQLWLQAPICGGCDEAVESTGDGWQCFHCNSYWDYGAQDGELGAFTDEYPSLDRRTEHA